MKNLPLIVAVLLPIIFIGIIAAIFYIPALFIKPAYDFLYAADGEYYYSYPGPFETVYTVKDGKLAVENVELPEGVTAIAQAPELFRYDIETGTSTRIEPEDAAALSLSPGPASPDGYQVLYRYSHSGFFELFGGGTGGGYYLTKGSAGKRLTGMAVDTRWSSEFRLVGWILE